MSNEKFELRVISYMSPSHPVQFYEFIVELLEKELDCHATLQYECRNPGPLPGRPDPFTKDKVDLAFMSSAAYLKLRAEGNKFVDLLPATPVYVHQMNMNKKPGYFSDVIINSNKRAHNVHTLLDLRGCTFAYSDEESLSSCKIVLKTLKEKGENASFFGSLLRSGSHLNSLQMVLSKQADWAAVDSTTVFYAKKFIPDAKDINALVTLGRLPPYPIVINTRLSDDIRNGITNALLNFELSPDWKKQFDKFGLIKFVTNSHDAYDGATPQMWSIENETLNVRYY